MGGIYLSTAEVPLGVVLSTYEHLYTDPRSKHLEKARSPFILRGHPQEKGGTKHVTTRHVPKVRVVRHHAPYSTPLYNSSIPFEVSHESQIVPIVITHPGILEQQPKNINLHVFLSKHLSRPILPIIGDLLGRLVVPRYRFTVT